MFFSARARHADARAVLRLLASGTTSEGVVVTGRSADEVAQLAGGDVQTVTLAPFGAKEGFLASGSLLLLTAALLRAYGHSPPVRIGAQARVPEPVFWREEIVVLCSAETLSVAVDLETRLWETGLAAVQASDLRNFAHGRHTGLARRLDRTALVCLSSPRSAALASATVGALPAELPRVDVSLSDDPPLCLPEGLRWSIDFVSDLGRRRGVDVGRPSVPAFGRRLYRLPLQRRVRSVARGPVERKLEALGSGRLGDELRRVYEEAFASWCRQLTQQRFRGLVIDYDGTVVRTHRRDELPDTAVRELLVGLVAGGLRVGIASGRGQSLYRDAREWLPEELWGGVSLGLYNGSVCLTLDEELPALRSPSPLTEAVADRVAVLPHIDALNVTVRTHQVTVEPRADAYSHGPQLRVLVDELVNRPPVLPVKVTASGHSVDIVAADASKVAVVECLGNPDEVLMIGDQGAFGGNDFELLAAGRWSLTVDRCSVDPTRCWFLGDGREAGPRLLARYLSALVPGANGWRLRWTRT